MQNRSLICALLVLALGCQGPSDPPVPMHEQGAEVPLTPPIAFQPQELPREGRLAVFRPHFERYADAFGVYVVATASVDTAKIQHATTVLAEWIDNDENGVPDDHRVHRALVDGGAFLVMSDTNQEMERLFDRLPFERLEEAGFSIAQDLYGEEALPDGPPHLPKRGRFDATLEEVLPGSCPESSLIVLHGIVHSEPLI